MTRRHHARSPVSAYAAHGLRTHSTSDRRVASERALTGMSLVLVLLLVGPLTGWTSHGTVLAVQRASMRPPRIHRILASIVALMLLVIGARSAQATTYRCAGDGVARSECCCPQADADDDRGTVIEPACCCDVELERSFPSVDGRIESRGASSHELVAAPVFHAVWVAVPTDRSHRVDAPEYVHRTAGPPLRLVKQSFLI